MFRWFRCLLFLMPLALVLTGCNSGKPAAKKKAAAGKGTAVKKVLTKEDYSLAIVLKNRGVGHIENKEWADGEKALAELAELLPQNLLARRNLAVSRVLALIDRESPFKRTGSPENASEFKKTVTAARKAVDAYQGLAREKFDTALATLLLGKLLIHADSPESPSFDEGLSKLQAAAETLPDAADFRLAYAMAMDGHIDYANANSPKAAELLRALQKSLELAPQNLFALQKLMQRQALCLNSQDEETKRIALQIPGTLKTAVKLLAPLNESIKKQRRMDLTETINKALGKFDGTNPKVLMSPAMMTGNLLLPELATQIDQRRLNKNLLEYLALDFDAEFLKAAGQARANSRTDAATVVKAFVPSAGLPDISGVTQVELLDMNMDGFDDLVVAREGRIEVYSRGTDLKANWQLIMSSPPGIIGVKEFLLADIDRDFDKAMSDIKNPSILRDADGDQKLPTDPAGKNRWYDTDLDVIAWSEDGCVVLRNEADDGARTLTFVPQEESIKQINDVVAADLEADGDLDLVFATDAGMTLWKNIDGTRFENMNQSASLPSYGMKSLVVVDWNSDVAIDVVGAANNGEVGYLENILHGRFRWVEDIFADTAAPPGGPAWKLIFAGAGAGDAIDTDAIKVVRSDGASRTVDAIRLSGRSPVVADLDNDGLTEILYATDGALAVTRSRAGLKDVAFPGLDDVQDVATLCTSDIDDDGDLDIVYVSAGTGSLAVLTNDGGNTNNWIDVVARAVPDDAQFPSNRVNMHAIGSVIELRAGSHYHAEVITRPKIHLGLGKATAADVIRIIWTDGIPQNVTVTNLLQRRLGILAPQILKGSCPYIYTWTGERFEFFSDCLWAAPLGLVQATGEIAPTREWENLLIPGKALVEKDGRYLLQLTEELWETAYFDRVELIAVDHPADVSIFTNEKVGPPSMAEHRIHTARTRRLPVSVTDGRGNDLLPGLQAVDGNYIQAFDGRVMQGLTDEWTMEFDLGQLASPKNVRLFLTGWVFPTDTSLNLGIAQNPDLQPPAPPSIEVPDGDGGWRVARPFIGFPSGKTKAMVVDISNIFAGDEYRFRLKSSMELYWEHAFFTVDEVDADTVSQSCKLIAGVLQYRGFSRRTYADNALFRNGRAPESYDFYSVTTSPRWPTIAGRFTRYGNTTPLLTEHDDQMVVMGPGDALALEFAVPDKPVPTGWKRDFVLRNIGYDKDADLNTIYGQSSEPFPFRAMSRYPFAGDDQVPDNAPYRQYVGEWQTREYSNKSFRDVVRNQPK